ncbi:MAG TPA: TolC family protein [Blastocatellia bacterium]|nr:TolC family protein [Blastocatellia bacterium]
MFASRSLRTVLWLLACFGGCAPAAFGQAAPADTLTLEQAVALALGENRQVKSAEIEVEKYSDRLAALRTRRLPEFKFYTLAAQLMTPITFTFEPGTFGSYPGIGPIPNNTTEITTPRRPTVYLSGQIVQPLSQLYRIRLNLKQVGVGQEIARQQLRLQQQTITNNVRRGYYAILQTQSSLQAMEESIRRYQELDRVTGEYVVQQVALKADSLEVHVRLEKAQYDALTLRDQLATQKEQFNQLLGRDLQTDFNVSPVPALSGYETDLASAREYALQQRPEIREAQLKLKQAEYDRRIKRSELIPEVGLALNYVSPFNTNFVPKNVASVGVSVSWEPFDWGRKKREISEKGRSIEQAALALREAENAVRTEVNAKYRKMQQARQLLVVNRLTQEASAEKLRVMTDRYRLQAALLNDVLNSQTTLTEADNQYQQTLLAFWAARADFEKALGGDR